MEENSDLIVTLSIRITVSLYKQLLQEVGKGKKWTDKSSAIRHYLERGMQAEAMIKISKDPKKKVEFENLLTELLQESNIPQTLEKYPSDLWQNFKLFVKNEDERRIKQLVLDMDR